MSDRELLEAIRREIAESPFVGEGHRKIRARLAIRGIHTAGKRVLRLTRGAGLLAPTPQVRKRSRRLHDAKITVEVPDTLWATDATEGHTREQGRCAVFAIIDHGSGEAWVDAAARMDRWAAADLLREVTTERFGPVEQAVAAGLALRYDGGPCFPLRSLPGRDRPPRHRAQPSLPLRARDQRLRRKVHPDAQGTGPLDRALRHARAAARRHPAVRRRLQPALAARTPRLPHPRPSARAPPLRRDGMISPSPPKCPVNRVRRSWELHDIAALGVHVQDASGYPAGTAARRMPASRVAARRGRSAVYAGDSAIGRRGDHCRDREGIGGSNPAEGFRLLRCKPHPLR